MTNFNNLYNSSVQSSSQQASRQASQQIERLWNPPSVARQQQGDSLQQSISNYLRQAGKRLVAFLTGEQTIRIWTTYSKQGVVWHVYDPIRDRRSSHASEEALRTWLEQRHLSS